MGPRGLGGFHEGDRSEFPQQLSLCCSSLTCAFPPGSVLDVRPPRTPAPSPKRTLLPCCGRQAAALVLVWALHTRPRADTWELHEITSHHGVGNSRVTSQKPKNVSQAGAEDHGVQTWGGWGGRGLRMAPQTLGSRYVSSARCHLASVWCGTVNDSHQAARETPRTHASVTRNAHPGAAPPISPAPGPEYPPLHSV